LPNDITRIIIKKFPFIKHTDDYFNTSIHIDNTIRYTYCSYNKELYVVKKLKNKQFVIFIYSYITPTKKKNETIF